MRWLLTTSFAILAAGPAMAMECDPVQVTAYFTSPYPRVLVGNEVGCTNASDINKTLSTLVREALEKCTKDSGKECHVIFSMTEAAPPR